MPPEPPGRWPRRWAALGAAALALGQANPLTAQDGAAGGGVWLKGDLHIHSRHSKDSTNNPVRAIIAYAERVGLDFLAITDHDNHVDGDTAHHTWADPEWRSDKVVLLYAAEWTTDRGHGNVFSAAPYDQKALHDQRDARDSGLIALKRKLGVHLSANHPMNKDHFGFSYDLVDSIEVWNSSNWQKNVTALGVWDDMLRSGRKLAARGGSDSHHGTPPSPADRSPASGERMANYVGTPTTWVFARSRGRQAIIDALTAGRASISASPAAPRVELCADTDGDGRCDAMMGDNLRPTGKPMTFHVRLAGGSIPWARYVVRVVRNGEDFATVPLDADHGEATFADAPPAEGRSYYRVEVSGPQAAFSEVPMAAGLSGTMVAISNPVFFNFDPKFQGN